jgi:replicative DNA helicase
MISNFKCPREIKRVDRSNAVILKTGLNKIDETMGGLDLGQVSIVSGTNGSAKSTILNQIALNIIMQGYSVGIFSGELSDWRLMNWLYLQAAGKDNVKQAKNKQGELLNFYVASDYVKNQIDEWLDNKLFVYDNDTGMSIEQIGKSIQELLISQPNVKFVILDNLMSMDIQKFGNDKNEAQKGVVLSLCQLAKKLNVHIVFVCHPNKSVAFLRKENISGSSDLANAVDNIFIFHRNTSDFQSRSREFFGWDNTHPIYQFDNIIEIAKNRELGCIEKLCGFYFEPMAKRVLNDKNENVKYGWEKSPEQEEMVLIPDFENDPF